jgi:regulator of RNase E activity RraA
VKFGHRDDIVQLTPLWKGDRFEDGRPRVSDGILKRLEQVKTEEAWSVLRRAGYEFQFEGDWHTIHPDQTLVGRAVTGTFIPRRPDLHDGLMEYGHNQEGRIGEMNAWVIQTLVKDDVMVIDLFGKIVEGTMVGGNLSTAVATRTGRGQVIYGGIRDAQQIQGIPNLNTFCKGVDPSAIKNVTLVGLNSPCRVGRATCMPGDVVLGTYSGVVFIPPHLAEDVCSHAELTRLRELFGFQRLREGIYNASQMDTKWTPEIEADFDGWRQTNTPPEYEHLNFGLRPDNT